MTSLAEMKEKEKSQSKIIRINIACEVVEKYKELESNLEKTISYSREKFGLCAETTKHLVEKYA